MKRRIRIRVERGPGQRAGLVELGMRVVVVRALDPARRHLEGREGTVIGFDWDIPILRVGEEIVSGIECYWGPRKGFPGLEAARALADAHPETTLLIWPPRAA